MSIPATLDPWAKFWAYMSKWLLDIPSGLNFACLKMNGSSSKTSGISYTGTRNLEVISDFSQSSLSNQWVTSIFWKWSHVSHWYLALTSSSSISPAGVFSNLLTDLPASSPCLKSKVLMVNRVLYLKSTDCITSLFYNPLIGPLRLYHRV